MKFNMLSVSLLAAIGIAGTIAAWAQAARPELNPNAPVRPELNPNAPVRAENPPGQPALNPNAPLRAENPPGQPALNPNAPLRAENPPGQPALNPNAPLRADAPAGMQRPSAADLKSLTDMRVGIIKAALQLTADQEKYWSAIEDAIRARAKNRQARWERITEIGDRGLEGRNPVELMQRRAVALSGRAADLKKLADAWEPLYKTLGQDQKERMVYATIMVMRGMRDAFELHSEFEDDDLQ